MFRLFFKKQEEPQYKDGASFPDEAEERVETALEFLWEIMKVVIIALAIILPVRYFLVQPFYVKGASMEPNFYEKDYLIVDEISYRFHTPARGDVIVFHCNTPLCKASYRDYLIKRVVGLPGEQVELIDGRIRIVNRQAPEGFYLDERLYLHGGVNAQSNHKVLLGGDEYFVLGDNRCNSFASEHFGPVKSDWIVGRAWLRGWPFTRAGFFNAPEYEGALDENIVDGEATPACASFLSF